LLGRRLVGELVVVVLLLLMVVLVVVVVLRVVGGCGGGGGCHGGGSHGRVGAGQSVGGRPAALVVVWVWQRVHVGRALGGVRIRGLRAGRVRHVRLGVVGARGERLVRVVVVRGRGQRVLRVLRTGRVRTRHLLLVLVQLVLRVLLLLLLLVGTGRLLVHAARLQRTGAELGLVLLALVVLQVLARVLLVLLVHHGCRGGRARVLVQRVCTVGERLVRVVHVVRQVAVRGQRTGAARRLVAELRVGVALVRLRRVGVALQVGARLPVGGGHCGGGCGGRRKGAVRAARLHDQVLLVQLVRVGPVALGLGVHHAHQRRVALERAGGGALVGRRVAGTAGRAAASFRVAGRAAVAAGAVSASALAAGRLDGLAVVLGEPFALVPMVLEPDLHLGRCQLNAVGQTLSFGRRQVGSLFEAALQFVNLGLAEEDAPLAAQMRCPIRVRLRACLRARRRLVVR